MAFYLAATDGRAGGHAALGDRSHVSPAAIVTPLPLLDDPGHADRPFDFTLGRGGDELTIHAQPLQVATCALAGPSELLFGAHRPDRAHHLLLEAQTRFTLDGAVGYGLTDRTVRQYAVR
jgi:hypothetical protein